MTKVVILVIPALVKGGPRWSFWSFLLWCTLLYPACTSPVLVHRLVHLPWYTTRTVTLSHITPSVHCPVWSRARSGRLPAATPGLLDGIIFLILRYILAILQKEAQGSLTIVAQRVPLH